MSANICPKHNLPRMSIFGRARCVQCKRESNERSRNRDIAAKRLAGMERARQRREDEALDARVERVWREKHATEELACGWDEKRLALPRFAAVREQILRRTA